MTTRTIGRRLTIMALLGLGVTLPGAAMAQTAKDLVGTWTHVSNTIIKDGKKVDVFGSNPKGIAIFQSSGRFALLILRSDLPKFAANKRNEGTAEENKAIVHGSIGFFGTYSVADKVITLKVEAGTYPNWRGTDQKREIISFTPDEFKWINYAGSAGGTPEVTWKRVE